VPAPTSAGNEKPGTVNVALSGGLEMSPDKLRQVAEEVGSEFTAGELQATNKMVVLALYTLVGDKCCGALVNAGSMLARWFKGDDLEEPLTEFLDMVGADCEVDEKDGVVIVRNCPECAGYPRLNGPACNFIRGFIAGVVKEVTGEPVKVVQTECEGAGDGRCVFVIGDESKGGNGEPHIPELRDFTESEFEEMLSASRDPEEVAAFKIASESLLREVFGDAARPMFFRAGRLYAEAFIDAFDPEDPEELVARVEEISGSSYELEGDRFRVEKCLECAGMESDEPVCHAVRGALSMLLEHYGIPFKRVVEVECSATKDAVVGSCEVRIEGIAWKVKKVADAVRRAFR